MNYIENILTDLGVKIGEEFNLKYSDGEFFSSNTYHFNDNFYLLRSWECEADFSESNAKILLLLLQGVLVIEKDGFNPVDGEIFYFPNLAFHIPSSLKIIYCPFYFFKKCFWETFKIFFCTSVTLRCCFIKPKSCFPKILSYTFSVCIADT